MKKQAKTKEKKKKGKVFKKILLFILLVLLIAGGVFGYKVVKNGGGLKGLFATTLGHDEETVNNLPKMYCLILGKSQNLTDTLILASYDPKTQQAAMLSIPRDTFVGEYKSSATSWDKINALYQNSPEDTLEAVRDITGINVKYYVMVDTAALRVLVDEIGGVTFNVPIDMDYDDNKQGLHIHLTAGEQLLNGDKAEQVVRFRHNNDGTTYPHEYGVEDIGRMKTQRAFLTALAKQTITVGNVTKITNFIDIFKEYVETNLDFNAIKDYIPYVVEFNMSNLKAETLPGEAEVANGIWIYSHYEDETEEVVNRLFLNKEISSQEEKDDIENINIEILNGTGSDSKLSAFARELEEAGYQEPETGKTTETSTTMIINRANVSEKVINNIKEILNTGNVSTGEEETNVDITIILGTDYNE